jgi:two-component system OmpR family sensor kinase
MFQLGTRGANSEGQGIGLHVSNRLLRQESGSIAILASHPDRPGCTVIVQLPVAVPRMREDPKAP